jgi:nucleotide-binding universal stress UspA family protein
MMTIWVGVDGSKGAAQALRWAVREGELRDIPVTAVVAWDLLNQWTLVESETFDPHFDDDAALALLDGWVARAVGGDAAVHIERRAENDVAWRALVNVSEGADLLVVGARGSGGFLGLRLGSVSERCLHHAKCPIAIIRDVERPTTPTNERIVVGVDGSAHAQHALAWALDEARRRGASVRAVTAWNFVPATAFAGGPSVELRIFEEGGREVLDHALEKADTSGLAEPVKPVLVPGGAAGAILAEANDATLVVVGARGLGGFKSLLLGSVSQQVAHHAPCPVVIIPGDRGD